MDIEELNRMDLMDFFHTSNGNHLRIVDRASAYKKHCKTKGQSTSELIRKLEEWLVVVGYPQELHRDRGPAFHKQFQVYCEAKGIRYIASSPYASSSNSMAEQMVSQIKTLWKTYKKEKSNIEQAIFKHNNMV